MKSVKQQREEEAPANEHARQEGEESCRISFAADRQEGGINSLADLDRLDRLAFAILLILIVSALGLILFQPGGAEQKVKKGGNGRQSVMAASPELASKTTAAVALLNGGDPAKAGELLDGLIAEFPYEGGPHMLKGDFFLRQQQPIAAMLEFRQGVDLNPDYLDKKMTDVFQGKKVKRTLEEARRAIDAGLAANPGDPAMRQHREILYYMLRKVAGSCG